jgi:hypothetical protein
MYELGTLSLTRPLERGVRRQVRRDERSPSFGQPIPVAIINCGIGPTLNNSLLHHGIYFRKEHFDFRGAIKWKVPPKLVPVELAITLLDKGQDLASDGSADIVHVPDV